MTQFKITRDNSGAVAYGLSFCDNNQYTVLTTDTEYTLTVPTTTNFSYFNAVFSITPGGNVWASDGATTLTLPTTSFASTQAQLNPTVRLVKAGDTLRFRSGDTGTAIGVSFYGVT